MTAPDVPLAVAVAGTDSSGGAGLAADLRTFAAFGVHGACVVTAVTAQTLGRVQAATPVAAMLVEAQLAAVAALPAAGAVKIGMLGSPANVQAVAAALRARPVYSVLDPVLRATAGDALADAATAQAMVRELLPLVALVTPNAPEAAHLTGLDLAAAADLPRAAAALRALGAARVLIKGGHLPGAAPGLVHDYYEDAAEHFWLTSRRLPAGARGTGCTLAAAIAAGVARGERAVDAVVAARAYVGRALRLARSLAAGAPAVLEGGVWPPTAADWPWATRSLAAALDRPEFPTCGPAPLGFYPVVDRAAWVRRLVGLGATTLQLRVKDLQGEALSREISAAVLAVKPTGARLFINDHWQLALRHGAYGVHLGQEDLATADLAALAGAGLRLGVSTHSYLEAAVAHALRPSYVALGPIFPTTCKSMQFGPQGLARIAEWRALLPYPVVAIGGLRVDHVAAARLAGADGVAAVSDIINAADPDARVRAWLAAAEGAAR